MQLLFCDRLAVVPVIPCKVLRQGIGQHLIHIDSYALHSLMVRLSKDCS